MSLLLTLLSFHKAQQLPLIVCFRVFKISEIVFIELSDAGELIHMLASLCLHLFPSIIQYKTVWDPCLLLFHISGMPPFTLILTFSCTEQLADVLPQIGHQSSISRSLSFSNRWENHIYVSRPLLGSGSKRERLIRCKLILSLKTYVISLLSGNTGFDAELEKVVEKLKFIAKEVTGL